MKSEKLLLILVLLLTMAVGEANADDLDDVVGADSLSPDNKPLQRVQQKIKYTVRGFDRLEDEYIEPQHYEWSVMLQATRNFEEFILSSNGQSIMFSPDQRIKVGPYFGWRWFFLGWTFDLKNLSLFSHTDKREIDFSI